MRKHRIIGFVLTAATVAGPLSLSATTPASASVVISNGGASWRLPLINVPLSLPLALPSPGAVTSGSTRFTAFFREFGTRLPVRLEGVAAQRSSEVAGLVSARLMEKQRRAYAAAPARLAAARTSVSPSEPTVSVTAPVTAPVPTPSGDVWAELRECESGGNYAEDTGNGFYGAYQFSPSTWTGLGYAGLPNEAPPAVQDAAAQQLQSRSGWGQWPGCSAKLGL